MRCRFISPLRTWSLALVLGAALPMPAAFELQGEALETLANLPVTVTRESLEARASVAVGNTRVRDGKFHLRVAAEAGLYSVQIGNYSTAFVVADGQKIRLTSAADGNGNGVNFQIEGSPDQALYAAYETFRAESLTRTVTPVRQASATSRARGDETEATRLIEREIAAYAAHRRELTDFTLSRLQGSTALYGASLRWDGEYRLEELATAVAAYSREHPGQEIARQMEERLARFRATAIGAVAPALAGTSPWGTAVKLTELRGQFVLIDFWASWCGPCRAENRHYAQLYERYHAAGFEILAVSVDENAAAWKAAIIKDGAVWRQLSDLKGWASPLAGTYNVTALPANYLLDREGRIIAKELRGEKLAEYLASLLDQKRP